MELRSSSQAIIQLARAAYKEFGVVYVAQCECGAVTIWSQPLNPVCPQCGKVRPQKEIGTDAGLALFIAEETAMGSMGDEIQ